MTFGYRKHFPVRQRARPPFPPPSRSSRYRPVIPIPHLPRSLSLLPPAGHPPNFRNALPLLFLSLTSLRTNNATNNASYFSAFASIFALSPLIHHHPPIVPASWRILLLPSRLLHLLLLLHLLISHYTSSIHCLLWGEFLWGISHVLHLDSSQYCDPEVAWDWVDEGVGCL